ncbi:hypothetical protein M9H77_35398 [Catharanthus roseus]|uniref:Uncharacterized protein n=1 Tax=Catharanthus roseus TaxID=4058 RepID=A0ACB9ZPL8_CATRO|nr:hypothetical protein M9H77_35398 [Catharanthus roseus]
MCITDRVLLVTCPSWSVHYKQYWIDMIERLISIRLCLTYFSGYKTSILKEVDDMTKGVLEVQPSSLTRYISLGNSRPLFVDAWFQLVVHPSSYVPYEPFDSLGRDDPTFTLDLTLDAPSHPHGLGTSYIPHDPFDSQSVSYISPPTSVGGTLYAPPSPSVIELSFDVPPPPSTTSSSVPYMSIFGASSFDLEEHGDELAYDVTPVQQYGFGHRAGKKTTKFTSSDWRYGLRL